MRDEINRDQPDETVCKRGGVRMTRTREACGYIQTKQASHCYFTLTNK